MPSKGPKRAATARGLVGPYRVDGAPQRLHCAYRRLPSALFQYVPAQVRLIEGAQRVRGAGTVVTDARRHALVPVPGVAFQGLGGEEAAGQVSHFLEQKARGETHVRGTGAAPRIGEGELLAGGLTGQFEQQPLLLQALPLERQIAVAPRAAVDPLPLGVQQQRILADHGRENAFGAAGHVDTPEPQHARAHHVADEHSAALEIAAGDDGLANGCLRGLAKPLRRGGNASAPGGCPVQHRQLANAVGDGGHGPAGDRRRQELREQLQERSGVLLPHRRCECPLGGGGQGPHHGVQLAGRRDRLRGALVVAASRVLPMEGEHGVKLFPALDQTQFLAQGLPTRRARRQPCVGRGLDPAKVDSGERKQFQQRAAAGFGVEQLQQVEGGTADRRAPHRLSGGAVVGYRGAIEHAADQFVVDRVHAVQYRDLPRRHARRQVLQHPPHRLFYLRLAFGAGEHRPGGPRPARRRAVVQRLESETAPAQPVDRLLRECERLGRRTPGQEQPHRQHPCQPFQHAQLKGVDVVCPIDQYLRRLRCHSLHGRGNLGGGSRGGLFGAPGGVGERRERLAVGSGHRRQGPQPRPR